MNKEDRVRLRHTDRWVGLLVVLSVAVFLGALFQRGVISRWFENTDTLTVLLPEGGVSGLSVGAEAEVLGIRAGQVRRIIVDPERRIRAELSIEEQAKPFIRADSTAVIRRRFGVAGPAYIDIQRGEGPPLLWEYAMIEATSERAPTETVGALLEEVQKRVFPILDELRASTSSLAVATGRLERGEGTIGRLLTDDTLARQAETAVTRSAELVETLQSSSRDIQQLTSALSGGTNGARGRNGRGAPPAGSIQALLTRADRALASVERATADLARATPSLPRAARNVEEGTEPLPAVVVQAQETARELELLLTQLRGNWLLGGSRAEVQAPRAVPRPNIERVRP
jgi:phospholipid/cholesterol/gamma-HCH transport system substrate-binding protein